MCYAICSLDGMRCRNRSVKLDQEFEGHTEETCNCSKCKRNRVVCVWRVGGRGDDMQL